MVYLLILIFAIGLLLAVADRFLKSDENEIVTKINELLPQTQCGQCGYPGCKPYAEAIAKGKADINRCQPGGARLIKELSALLGVEEKTPEKEQQSPQVVEINKQTCIGCTKCIQVCPTDCIIGSIKQPHIVTQKDCTGCELCIDVCPVENCITVVKLKQQFKYKKVKVKIN